MPKETIQAAAGSYDVRVGWGPDSVQLGVETAAGFSLVTMLYGEEDCRARIAEQAIKLVHEYDRAEQGSPAELGRRLLDAIECAPGVDPDGRGYTGVWATLNRVGINLLIRTLRRARDAAYGRDE